MKIIVRNIALEYEDQGTGQVLLFLHGWGDSAQTFSALKNYLPSGYRFISLDFPGFGQSEYPGGDWELSDYVTLVRDFLDKLSIKPEAIIGHSFGGRVAIKGLAQNILPASKLILIASAGVSDRKSAQNIFWQPFTKAFKLVFSLPGLNNFQGGLKSRFYKLIGSDYYSAGKMKGSFVKIINEDLSQIAPSINIPTLLIWGKGDTATPLADGVTLSKLIPNSRLETIPGAGHFVHSEKPEAVGKLISDFI